MARRNPVCRKPRPAAAPALRVPAGCRATIDTITSTIAPTSWEDVGGPGSIRFFPPTLDFVLSATDDVHEQIDILFDRLRKLPVIHGTAPACGLQPSIPAVRPTRWTSTVSIDVITSTVRPTSWEDVGGPGSLRPDEPKMALVVSQTQANQDAVLDLLTLLRRSRLGTAEPVSPYERPELTPAGPLLAPWPASDPPPLPLSAMPQPTPEDIQALEARRSPERDRWVWRRSWATARSPIRSRSAGRAGGWKSGCRTASCVPTATRRRLPGRGWVSWNLAIGASRVRVADRWLPWLPHRTNEELGQMFRASRLAAGCG